MALDIYIVIVFIGIMLKFNRYFGYCHVYYDKEDKC
ncbi:hypothetical protein B0P06_000548 [Clostridium saccharoperbutylacetonicum]|uniref:Uncharacterized protein n=1 Tax=Clostridium saccharoperbutylacetonicum N1-4(HMT) TaxID=931276 RepID=M1MG93_9CLOT|nr:hypothetical protein Cspa_c15930 [Clostridium saccharoperbutylacetonicum N1-4(HMT)]NRT63924.1 hypothetical protein [Clostridium saccharoperbutylacetonicum]NSB27291.1 hypothetical protein [Clostridium saccharoperbutylacetonicum]NSB40777.1 hypothetical protein [Clostridium saccharoperbutylacetonicum]